MTVLEDLVQEAQSLADESSPDWPVRAMAIGEHLETLLAYGETLREISLRLVRIAEDANYEVLTGASEVGHRIAAVAVALANNGLRLFSPTHPSDRVMIVDGVLATGAQLIHAGRRIREAGTNDVVATVVLTVGPSIPDLPEGIGEPTVILK